MTDHNVPELFADAVAEVVEELRWNARISSIRELARRAGMTHTSLNARFAKTTPFTVRDLAAVAPALLTDPAAILAQASQRLDLVWPTVELTSESDGAEAGTLPSLADRRRGRGRGYPSVASKSARSEPGKPTLDED